MNPVFHQGLWWLYANIRWMYGPVLCLKYEVYYRWRKRLCRHQWEETGYWARGKRFSHTVWLCPKCNGSGVFPMSDETEEFFFGKNGVMRKITLVEGDYVDFLKEVL